MRLSVVEVDEDDELEISGAEDWSIAVLKDGIEEDVDVGEAEVEDKGEDGGIEDAGVYAAAVDECKYDDDDDDDEDDEDDDEEEGKGGGGGLWVRNIDEVEAGRLSESIERVL